jgi:hypothetical protein
MLNHTTGHNRIWYNNYIKDVRMFLCTSLGETWKVEHLIYKFEAIFLVFSIPIRLPTNNEDIRGIFLQWNVGMILWPVQKVHLHGLRSWPIIE